LPPSTRKSTAPERDWRRSTRSTTRPCTGSSRPGDAAQLLAKADRSAEAATAYRRAIDLTSDGGVLDYLRRRLAAMAPEDTSIDTPRSVGGPP